MHIIYNKCTTPKRHVDNWGSHIYRGEEGRWEIFVHPPQFCCESKLLQKVKSVKKEKKERKKKLY